MNNSLMVALQEQMNRERFNHAQYRSLAAGLDAASWPGAAEWMKKASDEEQFHADRFSEYIVNRNGIPQYSVLGAPMASVGDNLVDYFQAALNLELANTEAIKTLYYTAEEAEDPQTCTFLIWALNEQTTAERELVDILQILGRLDKTGWQVFDQSLITE